MKKQSTRGDGSVKMLPPNGRLQMMRAWLDARAARRLFERLYSEIDWQIRTIQMFGRELEQPRRIAFQGDPGVVYRYSGGDYRAERWHPEIARLRDRLAADFDAAFNSVLVNLYRNGADSMGWHADDEPELGANPLIASVSLGAQRRFVLRNKDDRSLRIELKPESGSLLLMDGDVQHHWQHQLPKTARPVDARINLTFRWIHPPDR